MFTRSPIIAVLGHVDHGKTTLLDAIRGTAIAKKEAGRITQMIGASYVSASIIEEISKPIAEKMKIKLIIPGILFIDTPGHEAFANLRERGGSIADMAIVVVDITKGFQPQTIESIKILKSAKTPFVIAGNKVDLVQEWKKHNTYSFLESFSLQSERVKTSTNEKIYELMGKLSEYGFDSERFDKVQDFTKQVGIIPVSAKTKEGLGEILLLIAGLSQRFLEKELHLHPDSAAKGSIIEVKEEKGLGPVIDVIIYDGVLKEGDDIIFLGNAGLKKTKVRTLLEPGIKGAKEKFTRVNAISAAAGIKISAPDLDDAICGSPIRTTKNYEQDKKEIESQIKQIIFESDELGVVVKADSLGSVEAIIRLLKDDGILIKAANVGNVTKNDVLLASAVSLQEKYAGAVLAFNVQILPDAKLASEEAKVPIIYSNIIYQLLDRYNEWKNDEKENEKKEMLEKLPYPCKIKVLPGFFFRASKPAIFGVEVIGGKLKPHFRLMNLNGTILGEVKTIQKEKESLNEAEKGTRAAISMDGIVLNNDVKEGEILLAYLTKDELKKWKKKMEILNSEEIEIFLEIERLTCISI